MSIHLLEQAALLKLQPSTKLAFMAFCDSADKDTGMAFPGMDQVLLWAGVGKSRGHEIVAELIEMGLLARMSAGRRGRRAEFRVYEQIACCPLHEPFGSAPVASGRPDPKLGSGPADKSGRVDPKSGRADPKNPVRVRLGSGLGPVASGPLPNSPTPSSTDVDETAADAAVVVDLFEEPAPAAPPPKATRKTPLDPNWDPMADPDLIAWVKAKGAPSPEFVADHTEECLDWARANNAKYVDWDAFWRKWLARAIRDHLRRETWNRPRAVVQSSRERLADDLGALEELARREGGS